RASRDRRGPRPRPRLPRREARACARAPRANARAGRGSAGRERGASVRFSLALGGFGRLGHAARDADRLADPLVDFLRDRGVLPEELARVVLALADLLALVGEPGAGLLDDAVIHAHLDDLALA